MTDTQKKFLEIAKRVEVLKEEMKALLPTMNELMAQLPVNELFQDSETGLVYKIQPAKGTYVYFNPLEYVRTKKEGEDKGTLSKKEAEEAGFVLSK